MAVRQFKELERKDINQPDDKVTVTAAPPEGLNTNEGFKAQGETFEMPASAARLHQRAGLVNIGDSHPGEELEIRIEAHDKFWDSRKAVERAQKEAKANAVKDLGESPEETMGQPGLAEADSGNPRMFSGSQSEYEAKVAASEKAGASSKGSSGKSSSRSDDYEDKNKTELEDEAKSRDLSASNKNKQQLIEALREDDRK